MTLWTFALPFTLGLIVGLWLSFKKWKAALLLGIALMVLGLGANLLVTALSPESYAKLPLTGPALATSGVTAGLLGAGVLCALLMRGGVGLTRRRASASKLSGQPKP